MQIDTLAIRLRPRSPLEAADLGVRICQSAARAAFVCHAAVAVPVCALAIASGAIAGWLPVMIIWWSKPWLDRTVLFVLSRAAFAQPTRLKDLWQAQQQVWWHRIWWSLSVRRLSPWRSLTEPVYQLEGLRLAAAAGRARQIRSRIVWSGLLTTQTFVLAELALTLAVLSLAFWFAPEGQFPGIAEVLGGEAPRLISIGVPAAYAVAVLFLEPFYVGAGFAMYLNRRAELEAWDIEQEFRRAFA